jgi:transcriptional regulator with XRE-family HTH domain
MSKMKEFGARLRIARAKSGKTQEQLSVAIGGHKSLIGHWENNRIGNRMPGYDMVSAMAEALGVDHEWLATGFEPPERKNVSPMTIDEIAGYLWDHPELRNPKFSDLVDLVRFAENRVRKD